MSLEEAFGQTLKSKREALGLTQSGLAERSALDRTFISLLERGERQPSLRTLFSLAEALGITPEDLVREVRRCA